MTTLLVGFDSAWTAGNSGAIVGALHSNSKFQDFGAPQPANYMEAEEIILGWQLKHAPARTIVMLDQPTIVTNCSGQRHVEKIVCPSISVRYGGMQPANTARIEMFGSAAPIWPFLSRFGGATDPLGPLEEMCVFETYPVLAMIALGWTLPDSRETGRLPKYNPTRKRTFLLSDWQHVCAQTGKEFGHRGLLDIAEWIERTRNLSPRKRDQDCLDACICLLVGLYLIEQKECLMVGDQISGYILVPHSDMLRTEIEQRCLQTGLPPSQWVRMFKLARPIAT